MHNPCGGTSHPPPPPPHIPTKNDVVCLPLLQPHRSAHDPAPSPHMLTNAAVAASSWLRRRRIRYFFLFLCSPLLLLLLCAALPFLCAAELCLRLRLWGKLLRRDSAAADRLRRCEEGFCEEQQREKGLLHRYLEDQLFLVGSMYECGDDDDNDNDGQDEVEGSRSVEDVERIGSSTARNPLLR
ncbi:hypothetical protein V8G54_025726 [Vigna mungo]|uniref:Uncharacterized protein n=1 Tax=Vigna mungo TaxID=3915 RepID=A0AAQ3RMJ4_VIGMU